MDAVLVLNADHGPLHRVSLQHAIRMLCRKVAVPHLDDDAEFDQIIEVFPILKKIRLVKYIAPKWQFTKGPGWSKRGVLARDGHHCGYCGRHATTVDHITPRSQRGRNTWDNTVAACSPCNQRKADRTPEQAGMRLRATPYAPSWHAASAWR